MESVDAARAAGPVTPYATMPTPVLSTVADKLGISLDALRSQLAAGRPLSSIAAVAGLAHDALVQTVASARQQAAAPPVTVSAERGGLLL